MELFDTHFHCDDLDVQRDDYLRECAGSGVKYLLAAGFNLPTSILSEKFCEGSDNLWFSAGVHPHNSSEQENSPAYFERFFGNPRLAAVGEIGLDYYYMKSERKRQVSVFESFLDLALLKSLPAVIHCRAAENDDLAFQDAFSALSDFASSGGSFALHCYAGDENWTEKFIPLGAYFGFSGIVTFPRGDNIRRILRMVPRDKILLETDTPYLAPVPFRGKKNRSAYLANIARSAAGTLGITDEEISRTSTQNAFQFFRLNRNG